MRFVCKNYFPFSHLRRTSVSAQIDLSFDRKWGPVIQREIYYWLTSGQMSLTPLPRPDACLLPPNTHGLTVDFPRGSSSSEGRARSPRTRFLEHPAHQYLVPVVLHRRSTDKTFSRLTWLGSLLGNHPYRFAGDPLLLISRHGDHPGAVSRSLRSGTAPPIIIVPYRPPGHLHLKDIGPALRLHPICAPGLPARINFSRPHEAN